MLNKNCLYCGGTFTKSITESRKAWDTRHVYCSRTCANRSIAKNNEGNTWNVGREPWNKGKHPDYVQGSNHHNWKDKIDKVCPICGIRFQVNQSMDRIICCSKICSAKRSIGKTPWNKGIKTGIVPKSAFKKGQIPHNWKGDDVGYVALHGWVRRKKGKPTYCAKCGKQKARYEWANISREYKRDVDDYVSLCTSCHQYADYHKIDLSNIIGYEIPL